MKTDLKRLFNCGMILLLSVIATGSTQNAKGQIFSNPITIALTTGTTPAGNVGIGTTSPAAKLEIVNNAPIHAILRNPISTSYSTLRLYNDQNNSLRALEIAYSGSGYPGSILSGAPSGEAGQVSTTGAYPLVFGTDNVTRMTIKQTSGNIGIGTSTPASKLEINGDLRLHDNGQKIIFTDPGVYIERPSGGDGLFLHGNDIQIRSMVTPISLMSGTTINFQKLDGSTAMIVNPQTSKVGIGTTSPTEKLHIHSATGLSEIRLTDANTSTLSARGMYLRLRSTQDADLTNYEVGKALTFGTDGVERMRINGSTGSVGIGTSNPNAGLHLQTTISNGLPAQIKLDRNDGSNQGGILSIGLSSNGFPSTLLGGGSAYFRLEDPYGNSANSDMGFSTNGTSAQMVIKHNGNVGVGTATPGNRLEVNSGITASSGLRFSNLTSSSNTVTAVAPKVLSVNAIGDVILVPATSGTGTSEWTRTGSTIYPNNGTDKVLIGGVTCSPGSYKLYVKGGILTDKVKVAVHCSFNWADYVFADDYKLKSLEEVEDFINENNHLPGVPSANELVNEGLDLGVMQAKQMEKIEELTLYMIQMKKEIELLKKENATLQITKLKN